MCKYFRQNKKPSFIGFLILKRRDKDVLAGILIWLTMDVKKMDIQLTFKPLKTSNIPLTTSNHPCYRTFFNMLIESSTYDRRVFVIYGKSIFSD